MVAMKIVLYSFLDSNCLQVVTDFVENSRVVDLTRFVQKLFHLISMVSAEGYACTRLVASRQFSHLDLASAD